MNSRRAIRLLFALQLLLLAVVSPARAQFTPIMQPNAAYVAGTTLLPISGSDFDAVSSLTGGGVSATFDIPMVVLTTPTTWSSWGSPPNTESATPRVLWTNGFTSLTLTLSEARQLFGLEAQPNTATPSDITASFFNGMVMVGQVMRAVDGNGGALLFAATSTTPFDTIVLNSTDDFAIAQVRVGPMPPSPTPTSTPTLTPTLTPTCTPTITAVPPGGACSDPSACAPGLFCVDAVCCTSSTCGPLQRCDVPPNAGTCSDIAAPAPAASPVGMLSIVALLLCVAAAGISRRRNGRSTQPGSR